MKVSLVQLLGSVEVDTSFARDCCSGLKSAAQGHLGKKDLFLQRNLDLEELARCCDDVFAVTHIVEKLANSTSGKFELSSLMSPSVLMAATGLRPDNIFHSFSHVGKFIIYLCKSEISKDKAKGMARTFAVASALLDPTYKGIRPSVGDLSISFGDMLSTILASTEGGEDRGDAPEALLDDAYSGFSNLLIS